ncbi:MAG: DNA polymerase I [Deltaproteobacteria bacterium]|nr:DNA polymerase I [Deltaproteobacteria bacterium]
MKKICIVDVSAMFFRAFYAIRPLTSPQGLPVNALYGYLSMIVKLIKEEKPDFLALCYDLKEPSFRKDLYPEYKSNRTEMPPELVLQIPYLKLINQALGLKAFEKSSYEADDLVGAICEWSVKNNLEVYIVSGDKDFAQLVRPHVYLYDTMKNTKLDSAGVKEKWGVPPEHFRDYLALMGDASDNIPGVDGIGTKGAQKLINEYGTLDQIYENIEKLNGKIKENLIKDKENAYLSKKLVTIETNISLDLTEENLKPQKINKEDLKKILDELNFKNFQKLLIDENAEPAVQQANQVQQVNQAQQANQGLGNVKTILLSDFLEKYGLEKNYFFLWGDKLFVTTGNEFLEIQKHKKETFNTIDISETLENKLNWPKGFKWFGFNLKEIWKWLQIDDLSGSEVVLDTMLMAYVIRSKNCSEIPIVIKDFLQVELVEKINAEEVSEYLQTLNLKLEEELKNFDQVAILYQFEYPLISILYKMERKGFLINTDELKIFSSELKREIGAIEQQIYAISGDKFNVASPKQLSEVLFKKLQLEAVKKTKTGFSTDNDVLERMNHPIAKFILDFRELSKLKLTYVDVLPTLVNPEDKRIHTTFNQALTTTGRLSSSNPNLQNIPIKTLRGQRVRKSFIAGVNKKILSLDYSQIELRVLAHFADDPGLKKAFSEDIDIHSMTAAEVFNVNISEVTSELRRIAKAVNFGIAYGQGAFGLAETLNIPRGEASAIIKNYFQKFKNVKNYIEDTISFAHKNNYVETLFGRRRYLPELQSKSPMIKKFGERAAINAPIQGTASDIVKLAMIKLDQSVKSCMILQVHDELLFEEEENLLLAELPQIRTIMENVVNLKVPLKVNYSIGINWDEAH